jgi:hypothetical protein
MWVEMEEANLERISWMDVHAHLDEREDLPESLKEARVAGVLGILLEIEFGLEIE